MSGRTFEKVFDADRMTKRERVEATLAHHPVDRAALMEQLSYNPRVIEMYTGKKIAGFDYTIDDICTVIRKTMDMIMEPTAPRGTGRVTTYDGFTYQYDNWTQWHVSRPFDDEHGACKWMQARTKDIRASRFDAQKAGDDYRSRVTQLQEQLGETVFLDLSGTRFCSGFDMMGLEIFTFFQLEYPEVFKAYLDVCIAREIERVHAVADQALSPVILIAEDFATKQGPIFSPEFLHEHLFPYVRRLAAAWHEHDITALYHSDGNWRKAIPDLIETGVDGFYCLEKNCGMDVVEFKNRWPEMVWAGGVDGVDLMERGTPEQVREEVHRHIRETNVLQTGGMFVASSSEINPPIPAENFKAMVEAVGELTNPDPVP